LSYWFRSGFLALLEKATGLVFALGTVMLSSRGLTRADFAAWGFFTLISYFVEMGRSGLLQNGLMRFTATTAGNKEGYQKVVTTALLLNFIYALAANVVLLLLSSWMIRAYEMPQLAALIPIYCLTNVVMVGLYHCYFVQQANMEFRGVFLSAFFFRGILFGWIFLCWFFGWPMILSQMAWVQLGGAVVGAAACWYFARPFLAPPGTLRFMLGHIDLIRAQVIQFFQFGKYVLGTNLSAMFYKNIDKLALGGLLGPVAFAIYDVAGKVTQMVEAPSFSIAAVVFPQSAQRAVTEGTAGVRHLYERSVGAIIAIILPFLIGTLLFAELIIRILAGSQYADSAGVLRLTAFFGLFMPFAVQFGTVLDSTGHPHINFRYTFCTALLNLVLSYVLVKQYGLYGAACATLSGYFISFVFMQRYLYRHYGIVWWRAFLFVPQFYGKIWQIVKRYVI
jgi:lipopolysaccharide exporter